MSRRTGSAMVTAVAVSGCVLAHLAIPTQASVPFPGQPFAASAVIYRTADSGIDIVRMPPRPSSPPPAGGPSASQQPPATPPPSYSPPSRPSQTQGRLVKATVRIGSQPKDPQRGWLGVQMDTLEASLVKALAVPAADGVLILEAAANGPAAQAGLRLGDVIVGFDRQSVTQLTDLRQRVAALVPGREAEIEVWRATADDGDFLETLRRLGDDGNADAMYRLGRMYQTGIGVARNDTEAVAWYRKGSAAGNVQALTALGVALIDGRGVGRDPQEGIRLLRVAADRNSYDAMYRLGIVLSEGKVTAKDPAEALRLFMRAADAGHVPSMLDLALMYNNGEGGTADPAKAAQWYRRAADLGSTAGMVNLGFMYQQGQGVDRNDITAVALYRKAAAEGNPSGIHNLAAMLDAGRGVARKDAEQAAELIMQALDLRNEFTFRQMSQNSRAWSPEFRRALQRRLRDAGFYSGKIDGELRDTTVTAISAYMNRAR